MNQRKARTSLTNNSLGTPSPTSSGLAKKKVPVILHLEHKHLGGRPAH